MGSIIYTIGWLIGVLLMVYINTSRLERGDVPINYSDKKFKCAENIDKK